MSSDKREPVYYYNDKPTMIFNYGDTKELSLIKNDSIRVENNVYSQKVTILNRGNKPINREDKRGEVIIKGGNNDFVFLNFKESRLSNSFNKLNIKKLDNNKLLLDWNYFDPHDSFEVDFMYSSKTESHISIHGKVLGGSFKFKYSLKEYLTFILLRIALIIFIYSMYIFYIDEIDSNEKIPATLIKNMYYILISFLSFKILKDFYDIVMLLL